MYNVYHYLPTCSAGVGRTGTFITIDHVLEQAKRENVVDIPGTVNRIRQQRMKLVQTVVCMYIFSEPQSLFRTPSESVLISNKHQAVLFIEMS